MRTTRFLATGAALALGISLCAQSGTENAPVEIGGQPVLTLRVGVGTFTPAERATVVNDRLRQLSLDRRVEPVIIQRTDVGLQLEAGGAPLVSVTDADARAEATTTDALARRWAAAVTAALTRAQSQNATRTFLTRLGVTSIVVIAAAVLLWLLPRGRRVVRDRFTPVSRQVHGVRFRGLELVTAARVVGVAERAISLAFTGIALVIVAGAALLVFGQFPATQGYASIAFRWVWQPLADMFWGTVRYLPNLFSILVILLVTRTVMRVIGLIFSQADIGNISLEPWVPRDVARPTGLIVRTVVAIVALFFVAPLIPGTGSTAAQGLSVVIGLAVSFGSSSTVGNVIAGVILTYMRPFTIGDRVCIAGTTGDVIDRSFLHTKVLTIKNEEVVIPSLMVLGSVMTNYSARAHGAGLILHTSVTIGYDAPWRQVHELLIAAARKTPGLTHDPEPFVLQTALNDWYVSYQINAHTRDANRMATILSDLHERIQDAFNDAGLEIMSPHYMQLRDGNKTAIPDEYAAAKASSRRFLVDTLTAAPGRERG